MKDWIPHGVLIGVCGLLMWLLISTQATFLNTMKLTNDHIGFMHETLQKFLDTNDRQAKDIEAWHKRTWKEGKSGNPKEGVQK